MESRREKAERRSPRSKKTAGRVPSLGYYMIVTDTQETEKNYFMGLRDALPGQIRDNLVIKVIETKTANLVEKCLQLLAYEPQYRIPWIVFDRDQVTNFDKIIEQANNKSINVGWSNPCFEIWLFAYFGKMPSIDNSWDCCKKFAELFAKRTGQAYSKSDRALYKILNKWGDEEAAIKEAKNKKDTCVRKDYNKPSQMVPCSTVYELVEEIRSKIIS